MATQPEYTDWQQILDLIKTSSESDQHEMLLTMLLTPDAVSYTHLTLPTSG